MEFPIKKICGVCGDKALGYNFNALTCESCKAFFRRNALRNKIFRCTAGGNCSLTARTRKYCRHCRLKKCFEIGMRKDWILTEQDKKLNKHRKHRRHDIHPDSSEQKPISEMNVGQNDDNNNEKSSTNIIIIPILMNNNNMDQSMDNFKNNLIEFINKKIEMKNPVTKMKGINDEDDSNGFGNKRSTNYYCQDDDHIIKINEDKEKIFGTEYYNLNENYDDDDSKSVSTNDNNNNNNNNINSSHSNSSHILETNQQQYDFNDKKYFLINDDQIECCNSKCLNKNLTYENRMNNVVSDYISDERSKYKQQTLPIIIDDDDKHDSNGHEMFDNIKKEPIELSNNYNLKISDLVYRHVIRLEHTPNPLTVMESTSTNINQDNDYERMFQLNRLEQEKLNEVNHCLQTLYDLGDNPENEIIIRHMQDGYKYLEMSMKKLIITVKNVPSFKHMCQEDQIQLLKSSAIEIKWITNLRFFDESRKSCLLPNPNMEERNSFIVFDNDYLHQTYGEEIVSRLRNLFLSFRYDWRNDVSILNLLSMMFLFHPERSDLIHREYITLQFLTYSHLLRKYLQVKYSSVCEGRSIFIKLLNGIQEIRHMNEKFLDLALKMDMKFFGPLTLELYELNFKKRMNC